LISYPWQTALAGMGELCSDEPMGRHTTLGAGGLAKWYFRPSGRSELIRSLPLIPDQLPLLPLGRGSNLLVTDAGFSGLVLDLGNLSEIVLENGGIRAMAGARMAKVARFCAEHGLAGLEFMATVPGDIGGGIAMNAGAFGQQISDTLNKVEIVRRQGWTRMLPAGQLSMEYRQCLLPAGAIILGGSFTLPSGEPKELRQHMRHMRARRSTSQPLAQPNCGSVFKNPPDTHAAVLIEKAGLKGVRIGNARISDKHANFIVNEGGARSSDILSLIRKAQETVEGLYAIRLEPELRIVGEPE